MIIETFEQYTSRLLALAGDDESLGVLAETPARIAALIAGRSVADLQWSPDSERWSIAQIVSHLADAEIVLAYRARLILSTPGTPIQAYDQEAFSRSQRHDVSDAFASLALFTAVRTANVRLFRSLSADEHDRFGIHAERGQESLRHLEKLHAGHDRNHIAQIERLVTARDTKER